ncbi:alanine racemase [Rhodohalobacter sp. 8-1]|uniref:alanine racemase n=1 Tax=Rhodohalobacter sp. 8-1 TaxID=3131972 RepID=UPI0030EE2A64
MQILNRPKAVVFENNCRENIKKLCKKADYLGADFRPHFKTHQSHVVGQWFADQGVHGITVSTPEMAAYFSKHGWNSITIAFPFYRQQIGDINKLTEHSAIRLFVQNSDDIHFLGEYLIHPVDLMIEIDAGYNRSGISYLEKDKINDLISTINESSNVSFKGFYIHDGGTYHVQGEKDVRKTIERDLNAFRELRKQYPGVEFGLGDTPSSSLVEELYPVTELSPGNLIFYDLMQIEIGSCSYKDLGLLVRVPVVQEKPYQDLCIIHGGAVHFSKERLRINGGDTYGQPVVIDDDGNIQKIEGTSVTAISQEHGTVTGLKALKAAYKTEHLSELWVCPVHSCLTANLFETYITPTGESIEKRVLS